jgi:hypothetical protein
MKKYPRTFHFPFSPEVHSDDKVIDEKYLSNFINKEIIITEKYDGENSCLKPNGGVFARSHALPTFNPWSDWLKNYYHERLHLMNPDYWYFGENMYAIHSIEYSNLNSFFYLFAIYDTINDIWLSFAEIEEEAIRLNMETVKVIFKGTMKSLSEIEKFLEKNIQNKSVLGGHCEGFVTRTPDRIEVADFHKKVVKYVRRGHVQTDEHWKANWKKASLIK